VMMLDVARFIVIASVIALAWHGQLQLWHLYAMNTLVSAAFWMFWPTITALIQELTPSTAFVHANTFLLAGVQGGWLVAGAIVGFVYNRIGLTGVLLIDCATYLLSLICYFFVRRGKHVVMPADPNPAEGTATGPLGRYVRDMRDTLGYLATRPYVVLLGVSWGLFIGAMLTQGVITAPLSERVL